MEIKEIQYGNYGKCVSLSNGVLQAIVTIDFGPRIISFSRCDTPNPTNIFLRTRSGNIQLKENPLTNCMGKIVAIMPTADIGCG